MTFNIKLEDNILQTEQDDNLLECILAAQIPFDNACRSGSCHRCLVKCNEGKIPPKAQIGLKPSLVEDGYLLACQCSVVSDMALTRRELEHLKLTVTVKHINKLSSKYMLLYLSVPTQFDFKGGQSITIWKNETDARSYSIASIPEDNLLELHIKHYSEGCLTSWLFKDIAVGDKLTIQGPNGHCFYTQSEQPLLLIGNGTGLSPLIGIARTALKQNHISSINLIHYVRENSQLYYLNQLKQLASQHENFKFKTIANEDSEHKQILDLASKQIKENKAQLIYLAGSAGLVNRLRKMLFIQGAQLKNINSDIFHPYKQS